MRPFHFLCLLLGFSHDHGSWAIGSRGRASSAPARSRGPGSSTRQSSCCSTSSESTIDDNVPSGCQTPEAWLQMYDGLPQMMPGECPQTQVMPVYVYDPQTLEDDDYHDPEAAPSQEPVSGSGGEPTASSDAQVNGGAHAEGQAGEGAFARVVCLVMSCIDWHVVDRNDWRCLRFGFVPVDCPPWEGGMGPPPQKPHRRAPLHAWHNYNEYNREHETRKAWARQNGAHHYSYDLQRGNTRYRVFLDGICRPFLVNGIFIKGTGPHSGGCDHECCQQFHVSPQQIQEAIAQLEEQQQLLWQQQQQPAPSAAPVQPEGDEQPTVPSLQQAAGQQGQGAQPHQQDGTVPWSMDSAHGHQDGPQVQGSARRPMSRGNGF